MVAYALSPIAVTVSESVGTANFTLTRSGGSPAETVYVSTLNGGSSYATNSGDYTGKLNQAVVFAAGQLTAAISVAIINDAVAEPDETFGLIVQRSTSDATSTYLARSTFTIQDDDASPTSYAMTPGTVTVNEGAGSVSFTVTRSGGTPAETVFLSTLSGISPYFAVNSGDFTTKLNQALSFSAGQTTATVTVAITNDSIPEADETFGIIVQRNASDEASTYLARSSFTIHDDDVVIPTNYTLTPGAVTVNEGAGTASFTVTRAGGTPAETVYVSTLSGTSPYFTDNVGDFTGKLNQALVFTAGQTTATVTISIINDTVPEAEETFGLIIQRNASDGASTFLARSSFTIRDDDAVTPTNYAVTPGAVTVNENAGTASFTVARSGGTPAETVYVSTLSGASPYATNSGDFTAKLNQALVFAAGQTTATVTVAITNDTVAETDENFGLIIQRSASDPASTFLAHASFTIHDDDPVAPIDDFAASTATTGRVAVDGSSTGAIETSGDNDWFAVSLIAGRTYDFRLTSATSGGLRDPYLNLYDSAGLLLTSNDDGGGNLNSLLPYTAATSGTYFLGARDYSSGTGAYTIAAAVRALPADDFAATTATSGRVTVGGTATGVIETENDADWFAITLAAGQTYQFRLNAATSGGLRDPYLNLYNSSGSFLASNDDSGGNLNSLLSYTATTAGTYFIGARDYSSGTGAYTVAATLISTATDDFTATTATTGRVTVGGTATGVIETNGDNDWFAVILVAGQTYEFRLNGATGGLADPYLNLYNAAGNFLASNDDGGGNLNSLISYTATNSGTFYLGARAYGSGTGGYVVAATQTGSTTDDFAATTATTGRVTVGGSTTGSIESNGDNDWFAVTLAAGQSYEFRLTAASSGGLRDPYLNLYNSAGGFLTSNDDGGGNLNSLITYTATTAGTYYLGARDYSSGTGRYTVAATSLAPAPTPAGGFSIAINYSGDAAYRAVFDTAASRWAQVITGDLSDQIFNGTPIDDLLINASVQAIDGVGHILGQAAPDAFRAGSGIPYHGFMQFDSADLQSMASRGILLAVIEHEMGHVLGIGTIWGSLHLRDSGGTGYVGANGLAQYRLLAGNPALTVVPLERTGGPGTAGAHWSEQVFRTELMTGFAESAPPMPLSVLTAASLADLGYTVNLGAADAYSLPGGLVASASSVVPAMTIIGAASDVSDGPGQSLSPDTVPIIFAGSVQTHYGDTALRIEAQSSPTALSGPITYSDDTDISFFDPLSGGNILINLHGVFQKTTTLDVKDIKGTVSRVDFYNTGQLTDSYDYGTTPIDATALLSNWLGLNLDGDNYIQSLSTIAQDDIAVGLGGHDVFSLGAGADKMSGGSGSDIFIQDMASLIDGRAAVRDRITDFDQGNSGSYLASENDQIDISALVASAYALGTGQAVTALARVVQDVSGAFARLEVDPDGALGAQGFVELARLDGIRAGNTVNVILDGSMMAGTNLVASTDSAPVGFLSLAGPAGAGFQIGFDSVPRATAAQALLAQRNAAITAGQITPVTVVPGSTIPGGPGSGDGVIVVHQGGQLAMQTGYATAAIDASARVTLLGGASNNQIVVAGTGGLAFNGGAGTGTVIAGGGDNLVSMYPEAGAGSQNVDLGSGNDTVIGLAGDNIISAGLGRNQILLGSGANLVTSTGDDLIAGGAGAATISAVSNAPVVFLGSGPSRYIGGGGRGTVVGGLGADTINSAGNAQLWLGSNTDVVNSTGADTVIARTGSATVNAVSGNMFVFAGSGRLDFHGGTGASTVLGAGGASTLTGGAGSIIALAYAPMRYVGGNGADTIAAFGTGSALTATGGSGTALFLAGPSGHNSITGGSGTSIIFGGGDGDVLTAGIGAGDTIQGGTGAETISAAGTNGVHKLFAGSGPELIRTGDNNTSVLLSTGAATINAGAGVDLYAFTQGNHPDVLIQNFKSGADYITLVGFASGEAARAMATATTSGGSERLTLSDGTHITFQNFTGLTGANFL